MSEAFHHPPRTTPTLMMLGAALAGVLVASLMDRHSLSAPTRAAAPLTAHGGGQALPTGPFVRKPIELADRRDGSATRADAGFEITPASRHVANP